MMAEQKCVPLDPRLVKGPERFDGHDWEQFSFVFPAYVSALRLFTADELEAAQNATEPIRNFQLLETCQIRNRGLWYLLTQYLTQTPLKVLQKVEPGNGLEGWRQLWAHYEKRSGVATTGLLHQVMQYDFGGGDVTVFFERLAAWDLLLARYHQVVGIDELPDSVCKTLLIQGSPEPLKTHLQMADPGLSFVAMRSLVDNFMKVRTSWEDKAARAPAPVPMDVMAFMKGWEKGKGKSKGKGRGKTGKGSETWFPWCTRCRSGGHESGQCTRRFSDICVDESTTATTALMDWSVQCYNCFGWGHKRDECPSGRNVNSLTGQAAVVGGMEPWTPPATSSGQPRNDAGKVQRGPLGKQSLEVPNIDLPIDFPDGGDLPWVM